MKSSKGRFSFVSFSPRELTDQTAIREGERKIGEELSVLPLKESRFVVLGICEDSGPQANGGNPGAAGSFHAFLPKFLSVQSNDFLSGKTLVVPGYIRQETGYDPALREEIISELDTFVTEVLRPYIEQQLIPVIIGGGHNNAYPLLKAFSLQLKQKIAVVNCDAHADLRACDFRHSGNPFSFAFRDGYIDKYAVLGLHQSYNNQYIIDQIREHGFFCTWFDDLLPAGGAIDSDFGAVTGYLSGSPYGLELDMDAIEYMPSSALSPSGITLSDARKYVSFFASGRKALYLHLPEAAPGNERERLLTGKALAYLVCDFIKNRQKTL